MYEIGKINRSAVFILPLIGIDKKILIEKRRFVNTYLWDESIPKYRIDHIYLVHKNYQDLQFSRFEGSLITNINYVDSYDICDTKLGVKIFKIPESFYECYTTILAGGYSKVEEGTKEKIIFNSIIDSRLVKKILYKDPKLKEKWEKRLSTKINPILLNNSEVWSKIDMSKEILTKESKEILCGKKLNPDEGFL